MTSNSSRDGEAQNFPISDSIDIAIIMHREAHFGGQFDFMVDYYEKGGKGANPDFEISRIKALQLMENKLKQDLAPIMLSGPDAERIAQAKTAYQNLRSLYDKNSKQTTNPRIYYPRLIADLILSEEEDPTQEIAAIVAEKSAIVPSLIELIRADDFYDPLFPGYGLAPALAAKCLGLIGDRRAIAALFEATGGDSDFIFEDRALEALKGIGKPAKEFLLHVVHARPITFDNERAAVALVQFKEDPEVSHACLEMLKTLDLKKHMVLATYLILCCEGLQEEKDRKALQSMVESAGAPKMLQQDFRIVSNAWKKK